MIRCLRLTWQQLRQYSQGCDFEQDYQFIRACAHNVGLL